MEKQSELVQSDISYLKLDDSIKRNKLNTMQEVINENKKAIERQEAEVFIIPLYREPYPDR